MAVMKSSTFRRGLLRAGLLIVAAATCGAVFLAAQEASKEDPVQGQRLASFKQAGTGVHMTVFPVTVLGRPMRNVADAVGLVLEKKGMSALDAVDTAFTPPADATREQMPKLFGEFLAKNPIGDGYALYAEYLGEPKSGPTEVRFVVLDAKGALVLADRQTPADADFKKTAARDPDPMGCSVLVATRLFSLCGWKESASGADGKFARLWAEKSGMPGAAERDAMKPRLAQLKATKGSATLTVYPTLLGDKTDAGSATRLAKLLGGTFGGGAAAAEEAAGVTIAPSSNQQKRLWDLARGLREHVQKHPPKTQYAALVDMNFNPEHPARGGFQVVICDQAGEWVVVEFCNDVHDEWQRAKPKTLEDAEKVAAEKAAAGVR
ncbi:hypothetical protein RAS1_15700 [Phycisphaerae bacterium RAS1]|nr:hypothetical protein RAS1_15700 [Phycisphaerae bacterium RAS1]